jgi:hypothetical protein
MTEEEYKTKLTDLARQTAAEIVALNPSDLDHIVAISEQSDRVADQILATQLRLKRAERTRQ